MNGYEIDIDLKTRLKAAVLLATVFGVVSGTLSGLSRVLLLPAGN